MNTIKFGTLGTLTSFTLMSLVTQVSLTILPVSTRASGDGFDYNIQALGRTYSPGLSVNPNAGYGLKIWGDQKTPYFGFLRPNLTGSISPALFSGRAELEIYPISFIGLMGGRMLTQRFVLPLGLDCSTANCLGVLGSSDLSIRVLYQWGDFTGSTRFTRNYYDRGSDSTQVIYAPFSTLFISGDQEIENQWSSVLGFEFLPHWVGGIHYQLTTLSKVSGAQDGEYLFVRHTSGNKNYFLAAGRFQASTYGTASSFIAGFTITGIPAMGFGR